MLRCPTFRSLMNFLSLSLSFQVCKLTEESFKYLYLDPWFVTSLDFQVSNQQLFILHLHFPSHKILTATKYFLIKRQFVIVSVDSWNFFQPSVSSEEIFIFIFLTSQSLWISDFILNFKVVKRRALLLVQQMKNIIWYKKCFQIESL